MQYCGALFYEKFRFKNSVAFQKIVEEVKIRYIIIYIG